jgi:hypothetical protein
MLTLSPLGRAGAKPDVDDDADNETEEITIPSMIDDLTVLSRAEVSDLSNTISRFPKQAS